MRKIVLIVAFLLSSISLVNANDRLITAEEVYSADEDCIDVYTRTRDFVHGMTGSLHIGISAAIAAEEACLEEEEELEPIYE